MLVLFLEPEIRLKWFSSSTGPCSTKARWSRAATDCGTLRSRSKLFTWFGRLRISPRPALLLSQCTKKVELLCFHFLKPQASLFKQNKNNCPLHRPIQIEKKKKNCRPKRKSQLNFFRKNNSLLRKFFQCGQRNSSQQHDHGPEPDPNIEFVLHHSRNSDAMRMVRAAIFGRFRP